MVQMGSYRFHPLPAKEVAVKQAEHRLRQQKLLAGLEAARQNGQYSVIAANTRVNSS